MDLALLAGEVVGLEATEDPGTFLTAHGQMAEAGEQLATEAYVVMVQLGDMLLAFGQTWASTLASRVPALASRRTMSPSRSFDNGPPSSASGSCG